MERKYEPIDILSLYTRGDNNGWNRALHRALQTHDVQWLKKTLYGIQAGMADLNNNSLNSDKLRIFFLRLQKSLEDTAKIVFRRMYPNPCDDPLKAASNPQWLDAKRKRDQEFQRFLNEASF